MAKKIDPRDIQFFGPIWRRIALAGVMTLWCALEWYNGDDFWGWTTTAVLAYLIWRLFIAFPNAAEIAAWEAEHPKEDKK